MNPLVLMLLGRLLASQQAGIPAAQGPQGVAQGRHGEKGPAAAQRSSRNRMVQSGVNPKMARRVTGLKQTPRGHRAPPQQSPLAALVPALLATVHGLHAGPPQAAQQPLLQAMMRSPLMRGMESTPMPKRRSA